MRSTPAEHLPAPHFRWAMFVDVRAFRARLARQWSGSARESGENLECTSTPKNFADSASRSYGGRLNCPGRKVNPGEPLLHAHAAPPVHRTVMTLIDHPGRRVRYIVAPNEPNPR